MIEINYDKLINTIIISVLLISPLLVVSIYTIILCGLSGFNAQVTKVAILCFLFFSYFYFSTKL